MLTFAKKKVHRWGKFVLPILESVVRTHHNSRIDLRKRRRDKSDAPAETRGDWRRVSISSKKEEEATFFSPTEVWCVPAPSETKPEEIEFVVDSGASMHMLSRKDLNSAELTTVKSREFRRRL